MTTTFEHKPDPSTGPSAAPVPAKSAEAQTLITEQQVLFSTAAAVALTPAKTRRFSDAVRTVAATVGGWLASAAKPPAPPAYSTRRHDWLENALMSREMDRL